MPIATVDAVGCAAPRSAESARAAEAVGSESDGPCRPWHGDGHGKRAPNDAERMAIVVQQVDALQLGLDRPTGDEALALLRTAAASERAMPFEFGPPFVQKPTYELLAEQLSVLKKKGRGLGGVPCRAGENSRADAGRSKD